MYAATMKAQTLQTMTAKEFWIIFAGGDGTGAAKEKRDQEGKEKLSFDAGETKEQLVPSREIGGTSCCRIGWNENGWIFPGLTYFSSYNH